MRSGFDSQQSDMQLKITKFSDNPQGFLRSCGYAFQKNEGDEMGFVRRLTGMDYPRFHIYSHLENGCLIINLHLDQKKPSYEGTSAHGGEYDGDLVKEEIERIKKISLRPKSESDSGRTEKLNPW